MIVNDQDKRNANRFDSQRSAAVCHSEWRTCGTKYKCSRICPTFISTLLFALYNKEAKLLPPDAFLTKNALKMSSENPRKYALTSYDI